MRDQEILGLMEAYSSIYTPQEELTEEVQIAAQYFYEMGLNEEGIDILIEELGVEEFAEFVYDIAEEYSLTEARAGGAKIEVKTAKGKEIKGKPRPASLKRLRAQKEARKSREEEASDAKPSGMKAFLQRQSAVAAAAKKQPKKPGLLDRVAGAVNRGIERHNAAMASAKKTGEDIRKAATETGKTVSKAAKHVGGVAKEVGKGASGAVKFTAALVKEEVEAWVNQLIEEGYDLSEYTWDDMFEMYMNLDEDSVAQSYDFFDHILEHLVTEGYADTNNEALAIMANMSEEWKESIINEGFKRMNRRKIEKQAQRLGGDKGYVLSALANTLDTPENRKFSTDAARKNRKQSGEYRQRQHLRARDDAKSDIEKYGFH